ncbi:MAG: hypothetical protein J6N76_10510, partial [Lachnospiraceae bacterium]|nr:hypothetical protein [Lachnospiraceae bacterium]
DTFDGEIDEDEPLMGVKIEVRDATAAVVDTGLRDEIEQLMADLSEYDIDLFELPKYSPKAGKTKEKCAGVLEAFFRPPPLTEELKASKSFPFASLSKRTKVSRKLIDKHRKYLIASVLIKAGDYPGLKEFLPATKG